MRLIHYNPETCALFVQSERGVYEYRLPEAYLPRLQGFIKRGYFGKGWQLLKKVNRIM